MCVDDDISEQVNTWHIIKLACLLNETDLEKQYAWSTLLFRHLYDNDYSKHTSGKPGSMLSQDTTNVYFSPTNLFFLDIIKMGNM